MSTPSTYRPPLPEYAHPPLVAATLGVFGGMILEKEMLSKARRDFQAQLGPEWVGDWSDVTDDDDAERDVGLCNAGYELRNVLGDRVIRISKVHFAFTWLGTAEGRYPRYENLRDGFVAAWDLWCRQYHCSPGDVLEWGVCYLNRIPQGTVWQTPADCAFVKLMSGIADVGAAKLKSVCWRFEYPEISNGLQVDWTVDSTTSSSEPSIPNIWLRLTASSEMNDALPTILDGMDAGRRSIVQTFSDLMSPAANAYWGLRRRDK